METTGTIHIDESEYSLQRNVEDVRNSILEIECLGSVDFGNVEKYEEAVYDLILQLQNYLLPQLEKSISND